MNGFMPKTAAFLCLGISLSFLGGCYSYRQHVDPCWMDRYNIVERRTVNGVFDAQAMNGHILDQTIWNYYFQTKEVDDPKTKLKMYLPTSELNVAGMNQLKYLSRRRPIPDGKLYLQTAQDLPVDTPMDKLSGARSELDAQRSAAVKSYMAVLVANRAQPMAFEVAVHDPAPVDIIALPISGAIRPTPTGVLPDLFQNFKGSIPANSISGQTSQ